MTLRLSSTTSLTIVRSEAIPMKTGSICQPISIFCKTLYEFSFITQQVFAITISEFRNDA